MTKRSTRTYYTCGMSWNIDIEHTKTRLYRSIKELKDDGRCWKHDGIVRLKVDAEYVVDPVLPKRGKK